MVIVKKILISLPLRFFTEVVAIVKTKDLSKLTFDELHGSLSTFEMRFKKMES